MKKTKRELLVLAAATTVALSMGVTVQAKGDEKVLNFGCQMYTDGLSLIHISEPTRRS